MISYPHELPRTSSSSQLSVREWLLSTALLVVAATIAFQETLATLVDQWMTNDTYSFGVLVPPIALYFVWLQWPRLRRLAPAPEPIVGLALIGLCAAIFVGGRILGVIGVQEAAMVFSVSALVWLMLGRRYVVALWFPLLYLFLMLPIWEILTDRFHYRFQLFSALLSERLLNVIGVPVHRYANYLELPNVTLEVASVCSGVNFLLAVIAVGVPQAYLFLKGWWPRSFLIGFAVAIAILSNGLRIAIIGGLSHYRLTANIHGPGHILQGLFVSAAGLIALQIALAYLARRYPKPNYVFEHEPRRRPLPRAPQLLMSVTAAAALLLIASKMQPQLLLAASVPEVSLPLAAPPQWRLIDDGHPLAIVVGGPRPNRGQRFMTADQWEIEFFSGELAYPAPVGGLGYRSVRVATRTAVSEVPVKTTTGTVFVNNIWSRGGDRETDVVYWYEIGDTVTSQVTTAKAHAIWRLFAGGPPFPRLVVLTRSRAAHAMSSGDLADFVAEVFRMLQSQRAAASTLK